MTVVAIQGFDGGNMWNSLSGRCGLDIWQLVCLLWDKPAFKRQSYNGEPCPAT